MITERPTSKTVVTPTGIKFRSVTIEYHASAVYVGNRTVITAAHCLPDFVKNNDFISPATHLWYFSTRDKDGKQIYTRVIRAEKHPEYKKRADGFATRGEEMKNDIAVLLIDSDPSNIDAVEIDYEPFSIKYNCKAVGFPDMFMPRQPDDTRQFSIDPISSLDRKKIAVKMPDGYIIQDTLEHKIGYDAKIHKDEVNHQKRDYKREEDDGISNGMSGGGWFSADNKLIGIVSAQTQPDGFKKTDPTTYYSHVTGDQCWAATLFYHKTWLTKTIQAFQNDIPRFTKLSTAWYKQRAEHELKRDSKAMVNKSYHIPAIVPLCVLAGLEIGYSLYRFFQNGSRSQSRPGNVESLELINYKSPEI